MCEMSAIDEKATFGEIDSVDFAIYLNKKAHENGKTVNVTKIQKWLYICYGLYLAVYSKQLLTERPKAWDYGPAFPRVHKKQKKNGNSLDGLRNAMPLNKYEKYDDLIQATLEKFGDWNASELVAWMHDENKAWQKTMTYVGPYAPMDNFDILLDFKSILPDE